MDLKGKDPKSINVGTRLRELRLERGMSMRALARASGLSTNALSMIERGRTSPSVSTLYKIAGALGVPITAFFRLEPPRQEIVFRKADQRTRIPFTRGVWEGLGGEIFIGGMEPIMLTLEQGANSGRFGMIHTGHEFVMCLSGQLEYEVVGERFVLDPGDSLIFAAQLEHRWRNTCKETTRAVIVLSGFETGERPSEFHITPAIKEEDEGEDSGAS
jgi:transcriptional regulator with XRE-family HTH domain